MIFTSALADLLGFLEDGTIAKWASGKEGKSEF